MVEAEPSGFEQPALVITMLAPLFLLGGIVGTYIEFKSPGFGVPGAIAALCFILYFAGHYVAGLTGMEAVAVFVLGLMLVLIELIFIPGIVVLALAGTMMMFGALLWTMVDYYPGAPHWPSFDLFLLPLANLGVALGLAAAIFFLAQLFSQTSVVAPAGADRERTRRGIADHGRTGRGMVVGARGRLGQSPYHAPSGRARRFRRPKLRRAQRGGLHCPGDEVAALRVGGGQAVVEKA
ncbi:MAG: hypothetical protein VKI82_15670 [Leptolyngbya sp.]|nr:hypothetical protein [Leptolyngbya sp.]